MARAKTPNTAPATARRSRIGQETAAGKLRAAGWLAVPPERAAELIAAHGALQEHMANLGDKQPWDNRAMFERLRGALFAAGVPVIDAALLAPQHPGDDQ